MTSPLCVATGGWCRRVFHYRPPTPMYRNSPPLCTIVLQIPSLMPLKMRKVQLEAQFDPEAQGVPTGSGVLRWQVGEDDPGFFLPDVPDRQQGATAFCVGGAEGGAAANPGRIGTGNEVLCGQPAAVLGAEGDVLPIPHVGMPALGAYLSPQLGTGYAPVAEHDDGHFLGHRRGQFPEQFHHGVHPGPALGGPVDAPGHGNGATPVDHG